MNELKYCKFCDKEKPIKDFVKSGFAVKNICRECQNQKQTQIYKNSKKVEELQQENKQLKERIEYLERSNNRREDTIIEQRQEISDLEDNWNKLKEIVKSQSNLKQKLFHDRLYFEVDEILEMMQELERSD